MISRYCQFVWIVICCALWVASVRAVYAASPVADVHIHYNWTQAELVSPAEVLAILKKHDVQLAIAFSTPSNKVQQLSEISDGRVMAFFSPYLDARRRYSWFRDKQVLADARAGLASGKYHGIGEVHVISGMGPRRDNVILQGLLKLAAEYDVPFTIHTEASDYRFLAPLCQQHSKVRFLWAHAGGILGPEHARGILKTCPNVWIELSARDPFHYGGLVDQHGTLLPAWREMLIENPQRFMFGTDPVWKAHQIDRWDEADEGWLHYGEILAFHLKWIASLPPDVAEKIRLQNALQFFGRRTSKD